MRRHTHQVQAETAREEPDIGSSAAQYLRMSTDHQRYSTQNQAEAIARYAAQRGLIIVRTYQDDGKRGLQLKGRPALTQLVADAQSGACNFSHLIIYDVSRWGRFQNIDESAYYEFLCRENGLTVHYCAEQFANDGTLIAALIKNIKRSMAAEYSRELSAKVFAGQARIVRQGFHRGSAPGLGLRRLLVDQHRNRKMILDEGQYKSLQTDRVILIPGPPHEVALVRRIFKLFIVGGKKEQAIARLLNEKGVKKRSGRIWVHDDIHSVLTNEKYIGNNVFNLTSQKLQQKKIPNLPESWIRSIGCFEAIIQPKVFYEASRLLIERKQKLKESHTETYMLGRLRKLLSERGRLSQSLVDNCSYCSRSATYCRHFGSLMRAYRLIGYDYDERRTLGYNARYLLNHLRKILSREGYLSTTLVNGTSSGPKSSTYRRFFGGLKEAYKLIGYDFESNPRPTACRRLHRV